MAQVERFSPNSYGAKAEEDISDAVAVIKSRVSSPRNGIFLCEQAIEKYFKHIVVANGDKEGLALRHKLLPLAKQAGYTPSEEERYTLSELSRMCYERYPVGEGEELPEPPTGKDSEMAMVLRVQKWTHTLVDKRAVRVQQCVREMEWMHVSSSGQ